MATTKKPAAKKTTVKKPPVKQTVAKKTPAKKSTSAKSSTKKAVVQAEAAEYRSFRVNRNTPSFTTFKITRQTVYWIILVSFIIFAQLWILKLQVEVATLLEIQQTELLNDN